MEELIFLVLWIIVGIFVLANIFKTRYDMTSSNLVLEGEREGKTQYLLIIGCLLLVAGFLLRFHRYSMVVNVIRGLFFLVLIISQSLKIKQKDCIYEDFIIFNGNYYKWNQVIDYDFYETSCSDTLLLELQIEVTRFSTREMELEFPTQQLDYFQDFFSQRVIDDEEEGIDVF